MSIARYLSKLGAMLGSDGKVPTAAIADASVTNAKLANGYPNKDYVANDLGTTGFTTAAWVNIGSISIPSAGKWRVSAQLRIRWGTTAMFIKCGLFTSSTGGTNQILDSGGNVQQRMLMEQVGVNGSFGNLLAAPEWIVDMPTGLSYPYTIYLHILPSGSDAQGLINNDTNGVPTFSALKLASTSTSGTTPTCQ